MEIGPERRERIRGRFPALAGETVFLENAGGSQVPAAVADAVRAHMLESYVQLGAGHPLSRRATETVAAAHRFARLLMGGDDGGEVVLGPSTSALLQMLASAYGRALAPGSEIVVARCGHEANIGPWVRLEREGFGIRWWEVEGPSASSPLAGLAELLGDRTALVAFPHVSNLLGEVVDVEAATRRAHEAGARVVVDGVAFAPHRAMEVAAWGVDWYAFSAYKVYGPHLGALWGRREAMEGLAGPNHFFIGETPSRFELGGVCHEGCAGLLALGGYLGFLADRPQGKACDRPTVERAFAAMEACERPLVERLLSWLRAREDLRIVGPAEAGPTRVGTVSFVHRSKSSREIAAAVDRSGIALRHGHMYAWRLCEALGLDPEDGVVRVSLVHYNTPEEIERLIALLERVLG